MAEAKDINNGNILKSKKEVTSTSYFTEIGKEGLLSKEEEIALMQKIRAGDQDAYKSMIKKNLRLVVQIAVKYKSQEFGLMDRISEGNLGLIHAIEKFDTDKGFRFSTYAHWWIKQSIEKGIMNQGRSVRLPVHVVRLLSKYNKASCRMSAASQATIIEIAEELNCESTHLQQVLSNCESAMSLDRKNPGDSNIELIDIVPNEGAIEGIDNVLTADLQQNVISVLAVMPPYEHFIVIRHMGLMNNERNTLLEIAKLTGFSREQIRTRERKAINKYKEEFLIALK